MSSSHVSRRGQELGAKAPFFWALGKGDNLAGVSGVDTRSPPQCHQPPRLPGEAGVSPRDPEGRGMTATVDVVVIKPLQEQEGPPSGAQQGRAGPGAVLARSSAPG